MPAAINTFHILFTVIAFGILFGFGFALAQLAVVWPAGRINGLALLVCVLILLAAWLIP